jgi:hypothetical protein
MVIHGLIGSSPVGYVRERGKATKVVKASALQTARAR